MALNGIDISSFQEGINLSAVPADFVIVKITQGTNYLNPCWSAQYAGAKKAGRLLGEYHYAGGGDATEEADYFLKYFHVGESIPCLDWESYQNIRYGTANEKTWIKTWCDRVYSKTGVKPLIYTGKDVMARCSGIGDYGWWIAEYASMNPIYGYQETPWNEGAYSCAMRQYSGNGRLDGYNGDLDLDKFYGDKTAWKKYVKPDGTVKTETKTEKKITVSVSNATTLELLYGVMSGNYGEGLERKTALGRRYDEVQNFIEHIYSASASVLATEVLSGLYGADEVRKTVLGSRYDEVQSRINQIA